MLTEWKLFNFKTFKELNNFQLGPVTVLAGANSSGKTALLQSILVLAQTLSSPVATRPLILNGELVKLGTWEDVPHSDYLNKPVTFEFSIELQGRQYEIDEGARYLTRRPSFMRRRLLEGLAKINLHVSLDQGRGKLRLETPPMIKEVIIRVQKWEGSKRKSAKQSEYSIKIKRRGLALDTRRLNELVQMMQRPIDKNVLNYRVFESSEERSTEPTGDMEFIEGPHGAKEIIGLTFRHFLPDRLVQQYDVITRQLREDIIVLLGRQPYLKSKATASRELTKLMEETMFQGSNKIPRSLIQSINNILEAFDFPEKIKVSTIKDFTKFISNLPNKIRTHEMESGVFSDILPWILYSQLENYISTDDRNVSVSVRPISAIARAAEDVLEDFFANKVRYLGPLRDEPRVIYELPPTPDIPDVGIKGQYTAVVLDRNKDRKILFIDPVTGQKKETTLKEAVVNWLQHMGMLKSVSTKEEGKLGYKLTVSVPGIERELDLTTVGVGVSQVLPILVMALLATPGTLMIFEQPEIHLHPKVQSLLGDFFLSMGQLEKQCLIETHSEYLVNKLRFRIVEAKDDKVLKLVKIYFVERKENASYLREVKPNEYGAILDWPEGFFDEGMLQAESIIRLSADKQRGQNKAITDESIS